VWYTLHVRGTACTGLEVGTYYGVPSVVQDACVYTTCTHVRTQSQKTRLLNTYTSYTLRGISHLPTHNNNNKIRVFKYSLGQQQDPRLQTFSWTTYEHLQLAAPPTLPGTFHPYWHSLDFSTFHLLFDDRHNNIFLNIFCNNTSLALVPLGSFFFRMFVIRDTCRF